MLSTVSPSRGIHTGKNSMRISQHKRFIVRAEAGDQPGDKVRRWLQTPFDFAAFGPRITAGLVASAPENLEQLQTDLLKLSDLLQDPMPFGEKQEILVKEVETRISDYLERGALLEADALENLRLVLPSEIAGSIPRSDTTRGPAAPPSAPVAEPPTVIYTSESVTESQASAAVTGVEGGIKDLQDSMEALRSNESAARENMLKLNLKEAQDRLRYLLHETQPNGVEAAPNSLRAREIIAEADSLL